MLGAGLRTQANIDIKLNLAKNKAWSTMQQSVDELKASLNELAKTVGIEKPTSAFAKLSKELAKTKSALAAAKAQLDAMGDEEDEASGSTGKFVGKVEQMRTAIQGVMLRFNSAGKVAGGFASEIEEAGREARGSAAGIKYFEEQVSKANTELKESVGNVSKEEAALQKLYIATRNLRLAREQAIKSSWEKSFKLATAAQ